jgi:hypothetical protein
VSCSTSAPSAATSADQQSAAFKITKRTVSTAKQQSLSQ